MVIKIKCTLFQPVQVEVTRSSELCVLVRDAFTTVRGASRGEYTEYKRRGVWSVELRLGWTGRSWSMRHVKDGGQKVNSLYLGMDAPHSDCPLWTTSSAGLQCSVYKRTRQLAGATLSSHNPPSRETPWQWRNLVLCSSTARNVHNFLIHSVLPRTIQDFCGWCVKRIRFTHVICIINVL